MRSKYFYSMITTILGYFIYYNKERSGKTNIIDLFIELFTIAISMAILALLLEDLGNRCSRPITTFFKQTKNNVMFYKTSITTFFNGPFPFGDLPLELQCNVIDFLNKETRISLGKTSKYFKGVINHCNKIYNSEDYHKTKLIGTIFILENKIIADHFKFLSMQQFRIFYKYDWQEYQRKLQENSLAQLMNNYRLGYKSYFDIFSCLLYLLILSVKIGVNTEINATAQKILFKTLYSFIESEDGSRLSGDLLIKRLIKATYDITCIEYDMQFNDKNQKEFIQKSLQKLVILICKKFNYDPKLIKANNDRKLLLALDVEVASETNNVNSI